VSDFYGPPPPPPPVPPEHRPAVWTGPPDNELGIVIPLSVEFARADTLALAIPGAVVFSTGFSFTFVIRRRVALGRQDHVFPPFHPADAAQPDALRLGVQFANGAKATTLDRHPQIPRDVDDTPAGPLLMRRGGGGGGRNWNNEMWVWPLPPPGTLAFVCDWRAEGIPLTRREIDAQAILDAAAQVEELWPDDRARASGGSTSTTLSFRKD
jgi:hypothetical protein